MKKYPQKFQTSYLKFYSSTEFLFPIVVLLFETFLRKVGSNDFQVRISRLFELLCLHRPTILNQVEKLGALIPLGVHAGVWCRLPGVLNTKLRRYVFHCI